MFCHLSHAVVPVRLKTRRFSASLVAAVILLIAVFAVGAAPANKCVVNGSVTYQQAPCASGEVRRPPSIDELNAAEKKRRATAAAKASEQVDLPAPGVPGSFRCDGRKYCSQMTSCSEAKYFLASCPGVKMDGDKNGVPCEMQWCTR